MAHQILSSKDLFSVREVPWHGLGVIVEEAPSSEEAIKLGGLDWDVIQEPVCRKDGREVSPHLFNVRSDNNEVLGLVTNQYEILQNADAFKFTDDLIATGEVKYETAGCLNGGKRIWLLARLPEHRILEDLVVPYLCFTHGHDGKNAVKCALTADRVVCHNTLNLALANAERIWTAKHYKTLPQRMDAARVTLGLVDDYMVSLSRVAEELAQKKLTDRKVDKLLEALFPTPEEASLRLLNNISLLREGVLVRYRKAPDLVDYKGNGWGFVSAVADFATHSEPLRKTQNFQEKRFEQLIDGNGVLDRAVELVRAA